MTGIGREKNRNVKTQKSQEMTESNWFDIMKKMDLEYLWVSAALRP